LGWTTGFAGGLPALALAKTLLLVLTSVALGGSTDVLRWLSHALGSTVFSIAV